MSRNTAGLDFSEYQFLTTVLSVLHIQNKKRLKFQTSLPKAAMHLKVTCIQ